MTGMRRVIASACLVLAGAAVAVAAARDAPAVPPTAPRPHAAPVVAAQGGPVAPAPTVVERGTGRLVVVPGTSTRTGPGPLHRYRVLVEDGIGADAPAEIAQAVERVLADPRSWGAAGRHSFQRVSDDSADIDVVLASPATTDALCAPLVTGGEVSCGTTTRVVLNARRWLTGAASYEGRLPEYRAYVVNHEIGHALGRHHVRCPGPGLPAPVMMQQTLGVAPCRPSPWPFP
jgi:hypothetical protein